MLFNIWLNTYLQIITLIFYRDDNEKRTNTMKVTTALTGGEVVDFEMGVLTREGGGGSGKRRDCPLGHHLVRAG